ncbi:MAG: phage major tail protein, TP901-1 family [Lachnospiraceae bacterium]|nr:phage major tail protein, TP901-1 family [Lachnospiraceae bacterium]
MLKFDLQLFAEAVEGRKIVYLYRLYKDAISAEAQGIAFTTENSRSISKDAESTPTKDGTVRTLGIAEVEISCTSLLARGDEMIEKLEDAMVNGELMEIWEANLDEPATGADRFKGKYFQGYLTSFEKSSNSEDGVEISLDFGINGTGQRGDVTVTKLQQEMADYVFADTQPVA